jgi:Tfp pilus assembly protein PilN
MVDAVPRSRALAEVSNAAPAGIRLVAISLDAEPRVSQSNPSPAELSQACAAGGIARFLYVEGVASGDTQVSQFVTRLSKSPWLHEVRQLSGDAASARSTGPRKFEVAATFEEQTAVK